MQKPILKPLAAVLLVSGLYTTIFVAPAHAANIQEQVTVSPMKTITPQEENAISSAATKVLRHIAQARAYIHKKDPDAAKNQLDKAETLLDIIQASIPTTEVKDHIWVAKKHLEYEDSKEVLPDLVPIYSSLDELMDYMPVETAKKHLDKAKEHLKNNNKQKATEELEATDAALVYTEVDLPLSTTWHLVSTAKAELAKGNMDEADKILKSSEDSVVFMSVNVDEPLVTAKSSLWRASQEYAAGAYHAAKADVKKAAGYFEQALKSGDETTRSEAGKLLKQAKALEGKIENGGDNAAAELNHLWHRTEALSERAVEYVTTGWAHLRTTESLKSDLIEAKLHFAYAQIEQFTAQNAKQAAHELKATGKYLKKAAQQANKNVTDEITKVRIADLQDAVRKLANETRSQQIKLQYTHLKTQMRRLIQTL